MGILLRIPSKKKCGLRMPPGFTKLHAGASPPKSEEESNESEDTGVDICRYVRITCNPGKQSEWTGEGSSRAGTVRWNEPFASTNPNGATWIRWNEPFAPANPNGATWVRWNEPFASANPNGATWVRWNEPSASTDPNGAASASELTISLRGGRTRVFSLSSFVC